MDFNVYYGVGRIILSSLGLWPYQKQRARYLRCILLSPFLISGAILQVKMLMKQINIDWRTLKDEKEHQIIQRYAKVGRIVTIITIITMYLFLSLFLLIYLSPTILDFVMPLNETREQLFNVPFAMENFIPWKKCIFLLQIYTLLMTFVICNTIIATEILTLACVQHICGMFMITSYRIQSALNKSQMRLSLAENSNNHKYIIEAIDSHRRATEFNNCARSVGGVTFLILIPIFVVALSIHMYQFSRYISLNNIIDGIFSFTCIVIHIVYMFYGNYIGQRVMDHSEIVFKTICNTQWYTASLCAQKYLLLMMQRSMKSSTLKIGSLFVPSLENFVMLLSKSVSYFMVIYSTQT